VARTDALGVAHVTYNSDPGLEAVVPPRGLTAGKVSSALLADIGLPAHNSLTSPAGRRLVQEAVHQAQVAVQQASACYCW
jgi:hypothetical protein